MKKTIKQAIGKVVMAGMKNPVIRASINQEGYVCMPAHMQVIKGGDKHEDISQYPVFGKLAKTVIDDGTACLHYDRLYTIWQALNLSCRAGSHINTCEVGVYKGGTSRFICQALLHIAPKKAKMHYAFDTFSGHERQDILGYETHKPSQFDDTSYEQVARLLEAFDAKVIKGRIQAECGPIEGIRFNFVHLDVDLYEPTIFSLYFFKDKMVNDGIVIVDDYGNTSCPGVRRAVDEFIKVDKSFLMLHLITGQAVLFKRWKE